MRQPNLNSPWVRKAAEEILSVLGVLYTIPRVEVVMERIVNNVPKTGPDHPSTSREAERKLKLTKTRRLVYEYFVKLGPATDEAIYFAICADTYISKAGVATRRKELAQMGLLKQYDENGTTEAGNRAIRWIAVSGKTNGELR